MVSQLRGVIILWGSKIYATAQQEYSSEFSGEFEIEHDDTIANFSSENEESTFSDDPSTWSHVTEVMRSYWAKESRDICQHFDENFMASLPVADPGGG